VVDGRGRFHFRRHPLLRFATGRASRCSFSMTAAVVSLGLLVTAAPALAEEALSLEGKIALPGVAGRIDHMAVDLARKRLLVAELGNGSLDVVDLARGRRVKQIAGLHEPQGVAYAQKSDVVAVANAGDGSVRFFRGDDLSPAGSVALGTDADNVRIDPRTGYLIVGYGSSGLAIIDPEKRSKIGDIKLAAHPESFQLEAASGRIFVNVPDAGHVAVVDPAAAKQVASWTVPGLSANFPLAIDGPGTVIATVFRRPVAGALGVLAVAGLDVAMTWTGFTPAGAMQAMFGLYAVLEIVSLLLYRPLSPAVEANFEAPPAPLRQSRRLVYGMAALFGMDSFGTGFLVQSLLALWLTRHSPSR